MSEFEINGQQYRAAKLDAFKQFHVSRRLAPVLSGLAGTVEDGAADFSAFLQPIAEAVARMSDADCDFILDACLASVQRQQGTSWSFIYAGAKQALMFDDIDMAVMLQIAAKVIQENLGGFFLDSVANLKASTSPAA
ncbi:MAG TPA: hypothetical protein VFH59_05465 [Frateuria sp.]|uniref:phage tail assembly chaperone n=1 Tax=Frateuria sp. TaxID=2211372 RepID=UPI002D80882C|nr:hypothetical protein [Frateuria sp.]HET6804876.1 hypothetical protein [Frateuria sp.]